MDWKNANVRNKELFQNSKYYCFLYEMFKPFVQETLCMPPGLELYKSVKKSSETCNIPCKGINADVYREEDFEKVEEKEKFGISLANYKEYKSGFINGTEGNIWELNIYFEKMEEMEKFRISISNYKEYKSGFINGTEGNIWELITPNY